MSLSFRDLAAALFLFCLVVPTNARSADAELIGAVSLEVRVRPLSLALDEAEQVLYVGTRRSTRDHELYAIDVSDPTAPFLIWSLEVNRHIRGLAADSGRIYLGTSHNREELMIVDATAQEVVGSLDVLGTRDAREVEIENVNTVKIGRRRGPGPEFFRIDVSDPYQPELISEHEDPIGVRRSRVPAVPRYASRDRVRGRADYSIPFGTRHFLAVTKRGQFEVQIVDQVAPVTFPDVGGNGEFRLACLGDSNTFVGSENLSWCNALTDIVNDIDFRTLNLGEPGATAGINNVEAWPDRTAATQMQTALIRSKKVDAVLLAFGTNDMNQGHSPEDTLAALLEQAAVAETAGVAFYVGTSPRHFPACNTAKGCAPTVELNALIRATFPGRFVEFFDGFTAEDFKDNLHLTNEAQQERAERVFDLIRVP